jgi:type IV pilus assembly protein PilE
MRPKDKRGMTLLELMIVVAIVGILAAVAIPAYDGYVTRSRRSDAFTALETVRAAQEMYRAENGGYAFQMSQLPGCSVGMAGENYDISLQNASDGNGDFLDDDNLYQGQAQAKGKQTGDYSFQLDQNGTQWYNGGSGWNNDKKWEDLRKP